MHGKYSAPSRVFRGSTSSGGSAPPERTCFRAVDHHGIAQLRLIILCPGHLRTFSPHTVTARSARRARLPQHTSYGIDATLSRQSAHRPSSTSVPNPGHSGSRSSDDRRASSAESAHRRPSLESFDISLAASSFPAKFRFGAPLVRGAEHKDLCGGPSLCSVAGAVGSG
jgi:hypothetical protein